MRKMLPDLKKSNVPLFQLERVGLLVLTIPLS